MARLIHRGMGSQAFMGRARLALYVEEHPLDTTKSLLVQAKSNTGGLGVTQIFSKAGGQFEWCGVTRMNAQMLGGSGRGPDPHAFIEACFWLEEKLQDGFPRNADDLLTWAKQDDIGQKSLYSAKKALKVTSIQSGGIWLWKFPPTQATEDTELTGLTGLTEASDAVTSDNAPLSPPSPDASDSPDTSDASVSPVVTRNTLLTPAFTLSPLNLSPLDCLPSSNGTAPPCPHPETRTETMEDGSTLIRCTTCRYRQVLSPERSA
jgi:hypothetical protein